jgi:hypothetical protein
MENQKRSRQQEIFILVVENDRISNEMIFPAELDLLQSYFEEELMKLFAGRRKRP